MIMKSFMLAFIFKNYKKKKKIIKVAVRLAEKRLNSVNLVWCFMGFGF